MVRFAQEAWQELAKVTWPTRETVIRFTVLVLIISAVIAGYIFVVAYVRDRQIEQAIVMIGRLSLAIIRSYLSP